MRTTWSISRADLPTFEVGAVSPRTARRTSAASCIEICASAPANASHYRAQLSTRRQAQLRATHHVVSQNHMPEVAGTRAQKRQPLASFDGIMPAKSDAILKPPLISLALVAGGINMALMSMLDILACEPIMQTQLVLACSLLHYLSASLRFPSTLYLLAFPLSDDWHQLWLPASSNRLLQKCRLFGASSSVVPTSARCLSLRQRHQTLCPPFSYCPREDHTVYKLFLAPRPSRGCTNHLDGLLDRLLLMLTKVL